MVGGINMAHVFPKIKVCRTVKKKCEESYYDIVTVPGL